MASRWTPGGKRFLNEPVVSELSGVVPRLILLVRRGATARPPGGLGTGLVPASGHFTSFTVRNQRAAEPTTSFPPFWYDCLGWLVGRSVRPPSCRGRHHRWAIPAHDTWYAHGVCLSVHYSPGDQRWTLGSTSGCAQGETSPVVRVTEPVCSGKTHLPTTVRPPGVRPRPVVDLTQRCSAHLARSHRTAAVA